MGWLDNSTNNIILDAVLTDYGRQALARNDGSFRVVKFSLGDDEIDYSLITKYGRTIGREKIEKNTPVFEAFTNQNIGLKYKMISVPRPILYLPKIELTNNQGQILLGTIGAGTSKQISLQQSPTGSESTIDPDLQETYFDVYVPDMFLSILNQSAIGSPDVNKISFYTLSSNLSGVYPTLTFTVVVKSISEATFSVYGKTAGGTTTISTMIRVVGKSSGVVKDIPITITKGAVGP